MHSILPGWNNLDAAEAVHSILELGGLVLFALLVLFEVLAHRPSKRENLFKVLALVSFGLAVFFELCAYPYSRRVEKLSAEKIQEAESAYKTLLKQIEPRSFSEQKIAYAHIFLGKFQGTPFVLESYSDSDSERFGRKIEELLKQVGWKEVGTVSGGIRGFSVAGIGSVEGIVRPPEPNGVMIEVDNVNLNLLGAASALDTFLNGCHIDSQIIRAPNSQWYPNVGSGVRIRVGTSH